ncbi:MAG: peptide chain release factor N(5)-glutamine methyltransferase [Xanthomonadales bacterium]|nr:peptide chain release factor N(5)-glutamine methyltransferase [Xanthomonadales bacterium]
MSQLNEYTGTFELEFERPLTGAEVDAYRNLVRRRGQREPVAHLVGQREFWSLQLEITSDVLIPRPETELLVEVALRQIPPAAPWRVADLGTGSGAVAIAIAMERPQCELQASDCSAAALAVARRNAQRHAPGRIRFHLGSWLEPLKGPFDVVVGNPPYVAQADPHLLRGDCRFEPAAALTPGPDPLAAIREIVSSALPRLAPGGLLALEHGCDQGQTVRDLLREGGYQEVETLSDAAGLERVTVGRKR